MLCCNERDSLRCRKGVAYSPFILHFSICISLKYVVICFYVDQKKIKNYGEFCDTDMTSEKLEKITG